MSKPRLFMLLVLVMPIWISWEIVGFLIMLGARILYWIDSHFQEKTVKFEIWMERKLRSI